MTEIIDQGTSWVIERYIHSKLYFWTGCGENGSNDEPNQALRFTRQADAELMLTYHCKGIGRVAQHAWFTT